MASSFVKSNKLKRMESKKSHSWWWDSHISPKNSKWLQDNLEEMDHNVKRMLKLIEEDADSFAKKAELYFKKRPELISLVEEFYRIYRSLAERYDHVTGELRKNVPSDLHSQGSGISDIGSEPPSTMPSPDQRPISRTKSGPRAAGFEFFLGSGGSGSDLNSKEGDESSTLDSESESDDSSVNNYSVLQSNGEEKGLQRRIAELEAELREVKEKLRVQGEEISEGRKKEGYGSFEVSTEIAAYEEELRATKANMQHSEEEIRRLMIELQKYESKRDSNGSVIEEQKDLVDDAQDKVRELRESVSDSEAEVGLGQTVQIIREKLLLSEKEVASLRQELVSKSASIQNLQNQLKSAEKEVPVWKSKLEREKREVSKLQDRMMRYKNNLSDRDQEIRGLREAISNANKSLSEENEQLKAEMTRITKERSYLEDNLKEMDLRCQSLEDDVRRIKGAKTEMEATLGAEIEQLKAEIAERDDHVQELNEKLNELNAKVAMLGEEMSSKDDQIAQMNKNLNELHVQHVELIGGAELARKSAEDLRLRVEELEMEVDRKQEAIIEGEEEKREAIRQLCLSIEHYRSEYDQLRRAVIAHKRPAAIAT